MLKCHEYLSCNPQNQTLYAKDEDLIFIKCEDCGIIWRSPESMDIQKKYDEHYFDSKKYSKRRKHKIKKSGWLIQMALEFNPELKNLLEVGCSVGNTLEAARNKNIGHLGIDISQYAVEYCKKKGLNAKQLTLEDLQKKDERFQLIFMQHVLEHFPDPFHTLKRCHQLLEEDGLIIILVPNADYRNAAKKRANHRFYNKNGVGTEHYAYFQYPSLSRVLRKNHFRILQKNYPLFMRSSRSVFFFLNRLFRKSLSLFHLDQEILIIAQKEIKF